MESRVVMRLQRSMRLKVESVELNSRKDRWCSCEHSTQVNIQWAEEGFWPGWHFKHFKRRRVKREERIGDLENSAMKGAAM